MEFIDLSGTIHDVRKALVRHIKLFPHSARAKLHASRPLGKSFRELIQRRERTRECLDQALSTEKGIDSTVVSPPKETKEQPLDCDGTQSNLSLASGLQVEENNNIAERENLCESQSDLSMGLKTNEGGKLSHEVSLPIQATPNHGFVTKQAHFSFNPVDTVKSDAIVIQPSGSRSPQSYKNQEFARQAGRNRYSRRDLNQTHRDSNPRSHERSRQMSYSPVGIVREIHGQHMGVAPRDNGAALQNSISQNPQNQCQNSASHMHPEVQTSNAYPQTQIPGQHMSVAPSNNPATLQNSIPHNPQNQYHIEALHLRCRVMELITKCGNSITITITTNNNNNNNNSNSLCRNSHNQIRILSQS
ncbi:Pre-mRNA-processing factor 39-2 [Cardamine amara subsp. amara]|uniref:Pre-mRNA-processing factor 39-2 n=1 Tax=Cardamine amara subsp. amara TaxID=228776 RepID=A0ABD1B618_CARAN